MSKGRQGKGRGRQGKGKGRQGREKGKGREGKGKGKEGEGEGEGLLQKRSIFLAFDLGARMAKDFFLPARAPLRGEIWTSPNKLHCRT